ncbi:MAG: HAMP domain-containing sensor histidine kinase [Bacteroidota bacterium]
MRLNKVNTSIVIFIAAIALAGLCWVQYIWLQDSIAIHRQIFEQKIDLASGMVKKALEEETDLQRNIIRDLQMNGVFQPVTDQKIRRFADSVMYHGCGLDATFEYGIYVHSDDNTETSFRKIAGDNVPKEIDYDDCANDIDKEFGWISLTCGTISYAGMGRLQPFHFHMGFFFPNSNLYLLSEMKSTLGTAALFILLLMGCFSYTIITIRKQKRLSEMKNDFINNLTHEFKTPIFSIDLASGMLRKAPEVSQSRKLEKYIEVIGSEGKRLKNQVDKVLQMAMVDSGNFKLEKKQLDIHELVHKVTDNFRFLINERGGKINLDLMASKTMLLADETHLKNIIYNLLDNAQKYSPEQPVITLTTEDTKEGVALKIADNGIGMDEHSQRYIFDKFYRANTSDVHDVKGFGLGLSYVKSVIEAHQASIKLMSTPNVGSTFTLQFKA